MRWRLLVVATAAPLLLMACGDKKSVGGAESAADLGSRLRQLSLPKVDPKAPFTGFDALIIDELSADVPELAKQRDAILTAERDAIRGALDVLRAKAKPTDKAQNARSEAQIFRMTALAPGPAMAGPADGRLAALAQVLLGLIPDARADSGVNWAAVLPMVVAHQFATLTGSISTMDTSTGGGSKSVTMAGDKGSVDATFTLSAETGGPPTAELETKVDMPILFLTANSKVAFTGSFCPDADGKVEFTFKLKSNGRAGSGVSVIYDQNIDAKVTATVGDDAEVINADFDLTQATRSTAGGRQVYVETSLSARLPGGESSNAQFGEGKIIRASSQATAADAQLSEKGLTRAYMLALGALSGAKNHWQGGGCIKIEATSPGKVSPGATSKIPVAVKHKKDGSSVPAKVSVALAGGESVKPEVIAHAPGDITHVASSDRKAQMVISLKATSRRGKADSELKLSAGQRYSAEGGGKGIEVTGTIPDITQPFSLSGTGQGFTVDFSYSPSDPAGSAGTLTYSGRGGGVTMTGRGRYKVSGLEPAPGAQGTAKGQLTLNVNNSGCVDGGGVHSCRDTVEVITLTPIN